MVILSLRGRTARDGAALRCLVQQLRPWLAGKEEGGEEEGEGGGGNGVGQMGGKQSEEVAGEEEEEGEEGRQKEDRWGDDDEDEEESASSTHVSKRGRGRRRGGRGEEKKRSRLSFSKRHIAAGNFYAKPPGALFARLRQWLQQACQQQQQQVGGGGGRGGQQQQQAYCWSFPRQELAFRHHDLLAGWRDGEVAAFGGGGGGGGGVLSSDNNSNSNETDEQQQQQWQQQQEGEDALRPFATNLRLWSYQDPSSLHGRRFYTVCRILAFEGGREGAADKSSNSRRSSTNSISHTPSTASSSSSKSPREGGREGGFLHQYLAMDPCRRHVYEIIRGNYPCRLYFDVEFSRLANTGLDGERVMRELEGWVREGLREVLGLEGGREVEACFLELDSSTETKFSRHVIVHLEGGRLFRSNAHVGRFVHEVMGKIGGPPQVVEEGGGEGGGRGDRRTSLLWVRKEEEAGMVGQETIMNDNEGAPAMHQQQQPPQYVLAVDTSVYTKNRAFRLLYSRKFGKPATFQVTPQSEQVFLPPSSCPICPPSLTPPQTPQDWLLASLVVPHLPCGHLPSSHFITLAETNSQLSVYKLGATGSGNSSSSNSGSSGYRSQSRPFLFTFEAEGGKPSPLPALDSYVQANHMSQGGVPGVIRGWQYSYSSSSSSSSSTTAATAASDGSAETPSQTPTPPLPLLPTSILTYQVGRNRWCNHIGRAHKSNHTMVSVDLRRGCLYQRCHDPDCRSYKGPLHWLPLALVPSAETLEGIELDAALADACAKEPGKWG